MCRTGVTILLMAGLSACSGPAVRHGGTSIPQAGTADAQVYIDRCSSCHVLPHPKRLGYEGWTAVVAVMEKRIAERGMLPLDEQERQSILDYLRRNGR